MLLNICANGFDDAAELGVHENAEIRGILGEAAALVDAPLASELKAAAAKALNQRIWQLLESIEAKRAPRE